MLVTITVNGGFIVSCPALPGSHSKGKTVEGAFVNIRDQIMIIGEAVNHLSDEILSDYPQVPWRDIVGCEMFWFTRLFGLIRSCCFWLPPSGFHLLCRSSPG